MHYYKFNIKDWTRDTAHLSVEEEGVYRRLLDHYYESEQPIPSETQPVIRRLRLKGHEEAMRVVLSEFFTLESDGYRHKRCDDEIAKYHAKASANRENGKRGGRPKDADEPIENPDGFQLEPTDNLNHKPLTNNQESNTARKRASACTLKSWMEEIKQAGEKMIPAEDTIWQDGIPKPFLHLAWKVFAEDMNTKAKKAKDWRAQFRTYVRKDYLKLWAMNREGQHYLTTAGKQAAIRFDMKELMDE